MMSKKPKIFQHIEFDQIDVHGVFKPPDHVSEYEKFLRCTIEVLPIDFSRKSTLSPDHEINYTGVLKSSEIVLQYDVMLINLGPKGPFGQKSKRYPLSFKLHNLGF